MGQFPYICAICGGAEKRCGAGHKNCKGDQFCWEEFAVITPVRKAKEYFDIPSHLATHYVGWYDGTGGFIVNKKSPNASKEISGLEFWSVQIEDPNLKNVVMVIPMCLSCFNKANPDSEFKNYQPKRRPTLGPRGVDEEDKNSNEDLEEHKSPKKTKSKSKVKTNKSKKLSRSRSRSRSSSRSPSPSKSPSSREYKVKKSKSKNKKKKQLDSDDE